jgi:hypothetical protein
MKPKDSKKVKYRGGPSEVKESVMVDDYEIKVLLHGNTKQLLYRAPRAEDFEPCWFMDLQTAKNHVLKWKEAGAPVVATTELTNVESSTV